MSSGTQPFGPKIRLHQLPSLPQVIIKLIEACNNEERGLKELADIIQQDPALANQILKTVNSAYYGRPQKVADIDQAVSVLGTNTVKHIALCSSVHQIFRAQGPKGAFDHKAFWRHSLKSAIVAKMLAERLNYPAPDEAFLAGLLHDIGKLVLWINFSDAYNDLLRKHFDRPSQMLAGEADIVASHTELGAWLVNQWQLQSFIPDAIRYHHQPMDRIVTASRLVQIVYAANRMSQEVVNDSQVSRETCDCLFDLRPETTEAILDQSAGDLESVAAGLGLDVAPPPETHEDMADQAAPSGSEQLRAMVQEQALTLGLINELLEAPDYGSVAAALAKSIHILLDMDQVFLFITDPRHQMLRACPQSKNPQQAAVSELLVSMQDDASILVQTINQGRQQIFAPQGIAASDAGGPGSSPTPSAGSLVDQQLLRFMQRPEILCLPLRAHQEPVGVLVLGVTSEERSILLDQLAQLKLLGQLAATSLRALRLQEDTMRNAQEERLKAATHLARMVVHEVSNPLTIMKNYLNVLDGRLAGHQQERKAVGICTEEIDRVTRLLRPLGNLADVRPTTLQKVAINPILDGFSRIMGEAISQGPPIDFNLELDPNLPPVIAEKDGLKQVFINLLKNAMEALEQGGRIDIRTQGITRAALELTATGPRRADRVRIIFADNGPGMPAHVLDELYTPFVSGKEGHSGLGLSVAYKLVRAFNGSMTCHSQPGQGTRFVIELQAA